MHEFYTGVGSRETPPSVCNFISEVATSLQQHGLIMRSGGAPGADLAFERGVTVDKFKEIWIPWKGFNGSKATNLPSPEAFSLASTIHPVWNQLKPGAKMLHARNCHQVLGADLNTPSKFLLCWTEGGEIKGGTATAIKLALNNNIPVLNFGRWNSIASMYDALKDFFILNGETYEI